MASRFTFALYVVLMLVGVIFAGTTYYALHSFAYQTGMGAFMMGILEITVFLFAKWCFALIIFALFLERVYRHPQTHPLLFKFLKIHGFLIGIVGVVTLIAGSWLYSLDLPFTYRHDVHLAPMLLALPTLSHGLAPSLSAWLTLRGNTPSIHSQEATPS